MRIFSHNSRVENQTSATAVKVFSTYARCVIRNDNSMKDCLRGIRNIYWEWNRALFVQEQELRKLLNPAFSTPHLLGRLENGVAKPAPPANLDVLGFLEINVFVAEDDYVVLKHDQQVSYFLFQMAALGRGKSPDSSTGTENFGHITTSSISRMG
jgi:hypothetical protein